MILRSSLVAVLLLTLLADEAVHAVPCGMPIIQNGLITSRGNGRRMTVRCNGGYTLVGSRHSVCARGRWDSEIPMCLKPGCPTLTHPTGWLTLSESAISVSLNCPQHSVVAGAQQAFCNGTHWDRSLGSCRAVGNIAPATWCDFESDACGWTSVSGPPENSGNEWRRRNGVRVPDLQHTGPRHDHTVGRPLEGWYMATHVASTPRRDVVRLLSPSYEAAASRQACFRLWYHMYGVQVGRLRVYLKPNGTALADIGPDQVLFEKRGTQLNEWHEAVVPLNEEAEAFQVVVEAMRTPGTRLSNIAVDDVALLQGAAECRNEEDDAAAQTTPAAEEAGGVADVQTCAGRCDTGGSATYPSAGLLAGNVMSCECWAGCEEARTCCEDYFDECLEKDSTKTEIAQITEPPTTIATTTTTTSSTTTTKKTSPQPDTTRRSTSTTLPNLPATTLRTSTPTTTTTTRATTLSTTTAISVRTSAKPKFVTKPTLPMLIVPIPSTTMSTAAKPLATTVRTTSTRASTATATSSTPSPIETTTTSLAPMNISKKELTSLNITSTTAIKSTLVSTSTTVRPSGEPHYSSETSTASILWIVLLCSVALFAASTIVMRVYNVSFSQTMFYRKQNRGSDTDVHFLIEDDEQLDFIDTSSKKTNMECLLYED